MRPLISILLMALLFVPSPSLAAEPPPLEGTCVNWESVLNRSPLPHEKAWCGHNGLIIMVYDQLPDVYQLESLDSVFDRPMMLEQYADGAMIYLNNTWYIANHNNYVWDKEAHPFRVKETGRVMMPIRFFTEAIRGEVGFQDGWIRLSYDDTEVLLRARDQTAYIKGREVKMDQAPHVLYGRTVVPIRFVMEAFGATLAWDPELRVAHIQLDGAKCVAATLCHPIMFHSNLQDRLP